jgi:aspartyl/asparaginyl-tRNA synthetase
MNIRGFENKQKMFKKYLELHFFAFCLHLGFCVEVERLSAIVCQRDQYQSLAFPRPPQKKGRKKTHESC